MGRLSLANAAWRRAVALAFLVVVSLVSIVYLLRSDSRSFALIRVF